MTEHKKPMAEANRISSMLNAVLGKERFHHVSARSNTSPYSRSHLTNFVRYTELVVIISGCLWVCQAVKHCGCKLRPQ